MIHFYIINYVHNSNLLQFMDIVVYLHTIYVIYFKILVIKHYKII